MADPAPLNPDTLARKEKIMSQIRNELALVQAQELINKTNEKCFAKCISKPGTSLSGAEQKCLGYCLDRYMDAFNIVSKTFVAKLNKEKDDYSNIF